MQSHVLITAVTLIYGWLHTLEYIKGFDQTHAFVVMLKIIFYRDVLRILFIYVFVAIGFSSGLHVYALHEPTSQNNNYGTNYLNTVYHVFASMLGQGSLLDDITSDTSTSKLNYNSVTIVRLLFAVYLITSTIVLMNMLIAMMNHTYDDVFRLKETLWCEENLSFVTWVAQDNMLWMSSLCRLFCNKFVLTKIRKTDERYAVKRLSKDHDPVDTSGRRAEICELREYVKKQLENLEKESKNNLNSLQSQLDKIFQAVVKDGEINEKTQRIGIMGQMNDDLEAMVPIHI